MFEVAADSAIFIAGNRSLCGDRKLKVMVNLQLDRAPLWFATRL